jgi:PST family polysaccharide transporter
LQHVALMNREFRYSTIAIIDITTVIVGFIVTLVLALIRHDVWAIVTGTVVQSVTGAVLFVWASGWRPDRFKRPEDMSSLLQFGANASIYSISTFLSNNIAVLLIGRILGTNSVGEYNRAQALYTLPSINLISPIVQATTPLLARMGAHPNEYRKTYLSLVRKLTTFLVPAAAVLFFSAPPLVDWLLGPNWHPVGHILSALAPALVGMAMAYAIGDLLITQDRSSDLRTIGLVEVILRVSSIFIGVHFGLVATAVSFTISTLLAALIRMTLAGRRGPVSFKDQLSALAPSVPTGIGAVVGSWGMSIALKGAVLGHCSMALLLVGAGITGAVIVSFFFRNSQLALIELSDALGVSRGIMTLRRYLKFVQ